MKRVNIVHLASIGFLLFFLGGGCQLTPPNKDINANTFLSETNDFTLEENSTLISPPVSTELPEVVGVLINSQSADSESIFLKIEEKERYKNVVVLFSDSKKSPTSKETKPADKPSQSFISSLQEKFPNATVQTFTITSARQIREVATKMAATLPPESLIIVEAEPDFSLDPLVKEFQENFYNEVITGFEVGKFDELPHQMALPLQTFAAYLHAQGLDQVEIINNGEKPFAALIKRKTDAITVRSTRPVSLVFFGDIMLDRDVENLMNKNGLDFPFQKMDLKYLKMNDFLVANLEGPIAKDAVKTGKTIAFRFLPNTAPLLKKYFFDILSQANNHTLDMGVAGFDSTRELLKNENIVPFGDPRKINDESVATVTAGGQKIAFLGVEEVTYKINDQKAIEKIKELTSHGYKVIVFPHWGIEYQHEPNARQQQLAHEFIDAGAVAVVGAHPHVVESYENYNGHPIFYSLGNAIFDQYFSPDAQEGLSVAMELSDHEMTFSLLPIKIDHTQMRLMNQEERKNFLQKFVKWGKHTPEEENEILRGKIVVH